MSQDGLYDWVADQDCGPQPEPEDAQKLADDAALRLARASWANTKMLLESLGIKP